MEIREYQKASGQIPFREWISDLDRSVEIRIRARLLRIAETGNLGDFKSISDSNGVFELRFTIGAGYRIYFGKDGDQLIILLIGGDKGSQSKDIKKAKEYWRDYNA